MTKKIRDDELQEIAGAGEWTVPVDDGDDGGGGGDCDIGSGPEAPGSGGGRTGVQYDNPDGGTQDKSTGLGD